jgi:hypothetical protein
MATDTLYKYRALASLDFFLDIVLNKRLFAAEYRSLNDPMEGKFKYRVPHSATDDDRQFAEELVAAQSAVRICSLSETATNTLLWSYYAQAHTGVAIGLQAHDRDAELAQINYTTKLEFYPFMGSAAREEARKLLLNKTPEWAHEREIRVLTHKRFVQVRLKSIHLGCNVSEFHEGLLRKLLAAVAPKLEVRKLQ